MAGNRRCHARACTGRAGGHRALSRLKTTLPRLCVRNAPSQDYAPEMDPPRIMRSKWTLPPR
eukprot:6322206-Prymnesium_polylepis.1